MGGYASTIKLGRVGGELGFTDISVDDELSRFSARFGNEQSSVKNAVKTTFTVLHRRFSRDYQVVFGEAREQLLFALDSLNGLEAQELAFVFANGWDIFSTPYITEDGSTVQTGVNSHFLLDKLYAAASLSAVLRINGVFADYDPWGTQTSTNLYSSYNRTTGVITISPTQTPGTKLYVNWEYDGALVKIVPPGIRLVQSGWDDAGNPRWNLAISLEGV